MAVKIGYQNYGWVHFREERGISIPLHQMLFDIKAAGFNHIELCSPTEELGTADELRQLLEDYRLSLHALTGRVEGLMDWSKHRIDLLHELDGEVLVVNAGWIEPGEPKTDDRYRRLADGLEELAEYAEPRGVRVAYHNHLGTICETPEETARLFELTNKTGYCIDTGHLTAAGGDVMAMIEKHAHRIIYGHLKDTKKDQFTGEFDEFVDLGTGNVGLDVKAVIESLESHGFDGWLMVEQDHTQTTPGESAMRNAETLRRLGIEITK